MRRSEIVLSAKALSGPRFSDLALEVRRGEIVGFAGSEGNGQREALRALGCLEDAEGQVLCDGRIVRTGKPRDALGAGILSLSADRAAESIFPGLGVRENMTVQVLEKFAARGLISAPKERAATVSLIEKLNIVTADLDQPIGGLSGGNQQKTVLSRSFLYEAKALLIDEPTQGVDAKARFDIYRAIRAKADQGVACVINSSDAMELAGMCDRVLVFSRGRIIREIKGGEITEESIVSSFLRSKEVAATASKVVDAPRPPWFSAAHLRQLIAGGSNQWWVPLLFLSLLIVAVGGYASLRTDVFFTPLNIRHILLATAPLALVTMAQFNVLMVRGFDVSVGAVISLTVVIASFLITEDMNAGLILLGSLACLAVGIIVGLINGTLVRYVGINSVVTTIAMLSVVQGIALYLRPSPFGVISEDFIDFFQTRIGFMPVSFFVILAAAIGGDIWLYRTRSGLKMRAVGFREEAAKRNGVRIDVVHMRAFLLSAVIAVLSGLFVGSEVGVGTPVIGSSYTLSSIAAAVLGGAALTGGRGSFVGALLGALFFTLTVNIITLLGPQHRRRHHDQRGADVVRARPLFRLAADPPRLGEHACRLWANGRCQERHEAVPSTHPPPIRRQNPLQFFAAGASRCASRRSGSRWLASSSSPRLSFRAACCRRRFSPSFRWRPFSASPPSARRWCSWRAASIFRSRPSSRSRAPSSSASRPARTTPYSGRRSPRCSSPRSSA